MQLGEKIRVLLKENGLSQVKFAEEIGINNVNLNQYIKGIRIPPMEVVLKIIEYFPTTDLNWLLREKNTINIVAEDATAYHKPTTPEVLIENIERNLTELKARLSQN